MAPLPRGVVLFGPPASGKDTVTACMDAMYPDVALYEKLKTGAGRSLGYRFIDADELDQRRRSGRLTSVVRYGNQYSVDHAELDAWELQGRIPVVHTTDLDELGNLAARAGWLVVGLWARRRIAAERLLARGDLELSQRLDLWSSSLRDLTAHRPGFDHFIRTDACPPEEAARRALEAPDRVAAARSLDEVIEDPELVVPVVTLHRDGVIDWQLSQRYAEAVLPSGVVVLVAGTTGDAASLVAEDAQELVELWSSVLGPQRVVAGHTHRPWPKGAPSVRPLVVPKAVGVAGLRQVGERLPNAVVYSRERLGWTLPEVAPERALKLPFGVKITGTLRQRLVTVLANYPPSFRIWAGGSRGAGDALLAGADAVVVAALSATIADGRLPSTWAGIDSLIDQETSQSQHESHAMRVLRLTQTVRETLEGRRT